MPAYDYKCEPCDAVFEVVRSVSDRSEVCCPECGEAAKRVFTPVGVVFKGSGFHNTDYRSKPKDSDSSESGSSSSEGKPSEPKTESETTSKTCASDSPACKGCPASQES
jgi:putative FmdB family regulatory protein